MPEIVAALEMRRASSPRCRVDHRRCVHRWGGYNQFFGALDDDLHDIDERGVRVNPDAHFGA